MTMADVRLAPLFPAQPSSHDRSSARVSQPQEREQTPASPDAAPRSETLGLAVSGNEAAQRAIFEAFADRVFRLAYRMTGDATIAEDLSQDVFVRVFDRLHQYRGDAPFGAWLQRVAVTTILNALRAVKAAADRQVTLEDVQPVPSIETLEPDIRDRVRAALAALPPELRVVVVMFDIEGYAHEDIAGALGITRVASRTRLFRARQALRDALSIDGEEWQS